MSTRLPWSIKGVKSPTREAAKRAAEEAGLSLGDWLSQIIEGARNAPVPARLSGDPLLLSEPADKVPEAKSGAAAVEAVRSAIGRLLDRLQDSQDKGALTLENLEASLRELVGDLETSQKTLATGDQDQRAYLAGLSKDLFDLTTRVSLMEKSRAGNTEAAAIQILEEAIGRITAFIEAADKRQTDAITTIGSTLDSLAGEVGRQNQTREADRTALMAKAKAAEDKITSVSETTDSHHEKIIDIQSRVMTVERRQTDNVRLIEDTIDTRFNDLDESFNRLRDRLRGLEKRHAEETDTPVAAMEVAIDRLSRRLDQMETAPQPALDEKIRQQADALKETDQRLKEGFSAVTGAVEELASRLSALEGGQENRSTETPKAAPRKKKTEPETTGQETAPAPTKSNTSAALGPDFALEDIEDERAFDENAGLMRYLFALILIIFLGTSLLLVITEQVELPGSGGRPSPGSSLWEFFRTLMTDAPVLMEDAPIVRVEKEPKAG